MLTLWPSQNSFDYIALQSGQIPTVSPDPLPQAPHLNLHPCDHKLSAAPAQGWSGTHVGMTMPPPTVESLFLILLIVDEEENDIQALKKFNAADPHYAASALEYVVLDPCRVPWLKPPPVQSVPPGRMWSKWILDVSRPSDPVMKSVGKNGKHKKFIYYY